MEDSEFDIRGVLALLRRQLRLIIMTFVVVVGVAVLALFALTPTYTSSALIVVDPSNKNLLEPDAMGSSSAGESARVDSEVEIIRSYGVLLDVIATQDLVSDPEFGPRLGLRDRIGGFLRISEPSLPTGEAALRSVVGKLQNALSVRRRGMTYLVSVGVTSEDPARAAELANAVSHAYIEQQVQSKIDAIGSAQAALQARITTARQNIVDSEEAFDAYIESHLDQLAEQGSGNLREMRTQLERLSARQGEVSELADDVDQYLTNDDLQSVVSALESDALAELEAQREQLVGAISETASASPAHTELRQQLSQVETWMSERGRQELSGLRDELSTLDQSTDALRRQIRENLLSSDLPVDTLTRLFELQQSAELARTQYQTLLMRSSDLAAQADLQVADSRIVSPALLPNAPGFPNARMIVAIAGVMGLGLGIGLAFIYENYIGGIMSEGQAVAVLGRSVATSIPRQKAGAGAQSSVVPDVILDAPLSQYAESIRRLRVGIDQQQRRHHYAEQGADLHKDTKGITLMVSSSVPGEGKTTIALSLARSYALSGKRTLLIDCDLRRPSVHRLLGATPETGLFDYLTGELNGDGLGDMMFKDPKSGLSVLTGARPSAIPTDQLLMGNAFDRLVTSSRRHFDVVVLDTPPVLPVVDGINIAHAADIIAFVIRWGSTGQTEARAALARLEQARRPDTEILLALNQQETSDAGYAGRYASYYEAG